jgi:hypothetical protein
MAALPPPYETPRVSLHDAKGIISCTQGAFHVAAFRNIS